MDGDRFDAVTRPLAASRTRRGISRLLFGLALAGSLAASGHHKTAAKGKDGDKKKDKNKR